MSMEVATGGKPVSPTNPLMTAPGAAPASGVTAVAATFTSSTQSASFTPQAGRPFNVSLWGTFVASTALERSFDAGTTWLPCATARTAPDSFVCLEPEYGVLYRLNCTWTSGTVNYRISQ